VFETFDLDLSPLKTMESLDKRHSDYIDGTNSSLGFTAELQVVYYPKKRSSYDNEAAYNLDATPSGNTLTLSYPAPTVSQGKSAFAKFEAKWWQEHFNPYTGEYDQLLEKLGWYAHAVVGFNINGYVDNGLYPNIAFDAQQTLYYCPYHFGMYSADHNYFEHGQGTCPGYTKGWDRYSFADTRAANGGHPMDKWEESVTNIVPNLTCVGDDGSIVEYTDFANYDWETDYDNGVYVCDLRYNWSLMAAKAGYLPIHINPVMKWDTEEECEAATSIKDADVTAKFAVVYPIIDYTHDGASYANKINMQVIRRDAEAALDDTETPSLESRKYVNLSVFMMALKAADTPIDFSSAQLTGVDDNIIPDDARYDGDSPTIYYNLQGIRVMNPAKGQIYIVRKGAKTMKVLY